MGKEMSPQCPKCSATLEGNAPEGLCAPCLLEAAAMTQHEGPDSRPEVGTLIPYFGDYEVIEQIARGGMGIVLKARQRTLNRLVALKLISGGPLVSNDIVQRFRTEAEAAANLDHPNIVPIYEIGEQDGQHYFSMQLIDGPSLDKRLHGKPLPNREAALLLSKVSRALDHAHQRGVLHRDVKPGNILIDSSGEPRVTDFGLAKLVQRDSQITHTQVTLGTPSYMSPEQARGESKNLTTATDIYGLGAVLYETLTGSPPFAGGTSFETVQHVLEREPRKPSLLNPNCDPDLETICLKCLEKDPARRYPSAEAAGQELDRWLRGEPIQARPASPPERIWKWIKRHPVVSAFSAALTVAIVAGVVGVFLQWRRAEYHRAIAESERSNSDRAREAAETEGYRASIGLAQSLVERGDIEKAESTLLALPEALRNWEWGWLVAQCHQAWLTIQAWDNKPNSDMQISLGHHHVQLSRDGRLVAVWSGTNVAVFNTQDGKLVQRVAPVRPDRPVDDIQFSESMEDLVVDQARNGLAVDLRTGKYFPFPKQAWGAFPDRAGRGAYTVLYENSNTLALMLLSIAAAHGPYMCIFDASSMPAVRLIDYKTSRMVQSFENTPAFARPVLTPDGKSLLSVRRLAPGAADGAQGIVAWDSTTGKIRSVIKDLSPPDRPSQVIVMEENGSTWAALSASNDVSIYDTGSKQPRVIIPSGTPITELELIQRTQGHWLILRNADASLRVISTETGIEVCRIPNRTYAWDVSPDGRYIITIGGEWIAQIWRLRDGKLLKTLAGHRDILIDARFSPDGKVAITCGSSGTVKLWTGLFEAEDFELAGDQFFVLEAFSPDGAYLATTHFDRVVRIWDARTRQVVKVLRGLRQWAFGLAWSPDGRTIAAAGAEGRLLLWDVRSGALERVLTGFSGIGEQVAFSPTAPLLGLATSDGDLRVWNTTSWQLVREGAGEKGEGACLAWSRDGRMLAAGSLSNPVKVFHGNEKEPFFIGKPAKVLAWSSDGKWLAGGREDGTINLCNPASREISRSWKGRGAVRGLVFSEDGARLFVTRTEDMIDYGRPALEICDPRAETYRVLLAVDSSRQPYTHLASGGSRTIFAAGGSAGTLFEAFPWKSTQYIAGTGASLDSRIKNQAAEFWTQRHEAARSSSGFSESPPERLGLFPRTLWPEREADAPESAIDLTHWYNGWLDVPWPSVTLTGDLANDYSFVRPGIHHPTAPLTQETNEVRGDLGFDLRGLIAVCGRTNTSPELRLFYPNAVRGIEINAKAKRLYFVQGTTRSGGRAEVARYIIHYVDGTESTIPLLYWDWDGNKKNIYNWLDGSIFSKYCSALLRSHIPGSDRRKTIYTFSWINPFPEKLIRDLDFEAVTEDSSFLAAITRD
jgi:WD40 repeat protein